MLYPSFSSQDRLLRPYLEVDTYADKRTLHEALKGFAEAQLTFLLYDALPDLRGRVGKLLPQEMPVWLGHGQQLGALQRIIHMLTQVKQTLANKDHPLLLPEPRAHQPIYFWQRRAVTTPALLAIQAVLFSHTSWEERESCFHDVRAAARAHGLLGGYSEPVPHWIASLIVWQNAFRTAIGSCKECGVVVLSGNKVIFGSDQIGKELSLYLRNTFGGSSEKDRKQLIDALWLVAEAYEARAGERAGDSVGWTGWTEFNRLVDDVKKCWLRTDSAKNLRSCLVLFEYGHYLIPLGEGNKPSTLLKGIAERLTANILSSEFAGILWVSFDRYWATHHGNNLGTLFKKLLEKNQSGDLFRSLFRDVTDKIKSPKFLDWGHKARFLHLDFESVEALEAPENRRRAYLAAIGKEAPKGIEWDSAEDCYCWTLIRHALDQKFTDLKSRPGIPWAYVLRILELIAHITRHQKRFAKLTITFPSNACDLDVGVNSSSIWLPKDVTHIANEVGHAIETAIQPTSSSGPGWKDVKLVVARTLGALLWNQRMIFGNAVQIIEADQEFVEGAPEDARGWVESWWKVAEIIHEKYRSKEQLEPYLQVSTSAPVQTVLPRLPVTSEGDNYLLGVDIGGEYVKWAVYKYNLNSDGGKRQEIEFIHSDSYLTKSNVQYRDSDQFVEILDREILSSDFDWNNIKGQLRAVGVTWPGAVSGPTGHESVRSYSGILKNFAGFVGNEKEATQESEATQKPKVFFKTTPDDMRKLQIREAFAKHFFKDPTDSSKIDFAKDRVRLINDGVAHVLHAWSAVRSDIQGRLDRVVVIVAGTGTAMGIVKADTGRVLDMLAEPGKVVAYVGLNMVDETGAMTGLGRGFNKEALAKAFDQQVGRRCEITSIEVGGLLIKQWKQWNERGQTCPDDWEALCSAWKNEKQKTAVQGASVNCDDRIKELLDLYKGNGGLPVAYAAARMVGNELADLVALTWELTRSHAYYVGGGPMTGTSGRVILHYARKALEEDYGFHVVDSIGQSDPGKPHYLARRILLGRASTLGDDPSGAHGAAIAATQLLG